VPRRVQLILALLAAQALTAAAAPILLLEYTFSTLQSGETGPGYNPTFVATGLDASYNMAVRDTAGTITIEISNPTPNYSTQPVLRVDPDGNSSSLAQAVTNNKYWVFAFRPAANYVLDLDRLEFVAARGGGSTPRGWGLYSSADGYAAAISSSALASQRPNWTSYVPSLSSSLFQGVDDPLTFRMYIYSPADGSTIEFDNLRLYGEARLVPEPASLGLLGLGALSLVRRRARRLPR